MICHLCQGRGHGQRDCGNHWVNGVFAGQCFTCGGWGHATKHCSNAPQGLGELAEDGGDAQGEPQGDAEEYWDDNEGEDIPMFRKRAVCASPRRTLDTREGA